MVSAQLMRRYDENPVFADANPIARLARGQRSPFRSSMATTTRVSQVFCQQHGYDNPVLTTGGNITICIAADAVLDGVVGQLKQKPTLANIKKAMGAVLAQAGEVATHAEKEAKKALKSNGAQLTFSTDDVATQFKEKTGSDIDDKKVRPSSPTHSSTLANRAAELIL